MIHDVFRHRDRLRSICRVVVIVATMLACGVARSAVALTMDDAPLSTRVLSLPTKVGAWTRAAEPRVIDARTIFDYMDGGGELYLAYGFGELYVYEFKAPSAPAILVEIYWMKSTLGALGVLSTDWGGEAVALTGTGPGPTEVWRRRGLYGGGLLRLAAGSVFARVMAAKETPESRRAVLDIGRAIAGGRTLEPVPALMAALPSSISGLVLRRERTCYLESHLVLNSQYFVSTNDILGLRDAAAVATQYTTPDTVASRTRVTAVLVQYESERAAQTALGRFVREYLREPAGPAADILKGARRVEDGWAAYARSGRYLALVFEGTTQAIVADVAAATVRAVAVGST